MEQNTIDAQYTDGVWYDTMNGDYCKIQENREENLVELVNPETDEVYWDFEKEEWEDEKDDFVEVMSKAVNDPVAFYRATVESLVDSSQYGGTALPFTEEISFDYARCQVELVES